MELNKYYRNLRFPLAAWRAAYEASLVGVNEPKIRWAALTISYGDLRWSFDNLEEFFAEYNRAAEATMHALVYSKEKRIGSVWINVGERSTTISISDFERAEIMRIKNVFDGFSSQAAILVQESIEAESLEEENSAPTVFIGHGHNDDWRKLKDHLQDKHGYKVAAFEVGARAGHTARDILEDMLDESSVASLVMTAEDEQRDGGIRARQNVVHEAGLFQGRLGFSRAIILREDGVEPFSNLAGVQYIPFATGHIDSTFGEVLAVIRREFYS